MFSRWHVLLVIGHLVGTAFTDLALSLVLEFFLFLLLLRQFFLTFLVAVIRCCQNSLSSDWSQLYHCAAYAQRQVRSFLLQAVAASACALTSGQFLQSLRQIGLQIGDGFQTNGKTHQRAGF